MPKTYMTKDVLAQVLLEFEWPTSYTLDDDWLPDGIAMVFPKCELLFVESFESDMLLKFLADSTGLPQSVTLTEAMISLRDERGTLETPGLTGYVSPGASLEKVQNGIRDLCTKVLTHFHASLLGDFGWVEQLKEYRVRTRAANTK